jgi:hypothetical protein
MTIAETLIIIFMVIIIITLYLIYQTLSNTQKKIKNITHLLTTENYNAPTSIPVTFNVDSRYNYNSSLSIETSGKHSITLQTGGTVNLRDVDYFIKRMTIDINFTNNKKTTVHLTTGRTSTFQIPQGETISSLQLQTFYYYFNASNPEGITVKLTLQDCLIVPVLVYVTFAVI